MRFLFETIFFASNKMITASRSLEGDLAFGKKSESEEYQLIKQLDPELIKTPNEYDLFDYESPNSFVELKTRTFEMMKYPTTIVGTNKIKYAEEHPEKDFYFCFKFTDGLFYSKYNKEVYSKFKKTKCKREDRGKIEIMEVINIPIKFLCKIHKRNTDGTYSVDFK